MGFQECSVLRTLQMSRPYNAVSNVCPGPCKCPRRGPPETTLLGLGLFPSGPHLRFPQVPAHSRVRILAPSLPGVALPQALMSCHHHGSAALQAVAEPLPPFSASRNDFFSELLCILEVLTKCVYFALSGTGMFLLPLEKVIFYHFEGFYSTRSVCGIQ